MFAPVVERHVGEPAAPDRPQGLDILTHPGRRRAPGHREAAFVVALDLAAEAEDEAALGGPLQVPAHIGDRHGAAEKGDGDAGGEFHAGVYRY